jgi:hypothetical protein
VHDVLVVLNLHPPFVESGCGQLSPDVVVVVDNGACVPSHHVDTETLRCDATFGCVQKDNLDIEN